MCCSICKSVFVKKMIVFKTPFLRAKILGFGFVAGEDNVSRGTSRKKCCKWKVFSADLLCVVSVDCNHGAEKKAWETHACGTRKGCLCCGQLVEI